MRKMESNLVAFARVLGNTTFHVIGLLVFVIIQRQCSVQWRSSQKRVTLPFVSDYFFVTRVRLLSVWPAKLGSCVTLSAMTQQKKKYDVIRLTK